MSDQPHLGLATRARFALKAAVGIFSENSARAAWGLLGGVMPGGMGVPPVRGTADYLRAYSQMPWLRAVASRVSTATAGAEWQLFVRKKGNERARRDRLLQRATKAERVRLIKEATEQGDLQRLERHLLLETLTNFNEFQTGFAARKVTQLHLDLVGDAFWLKERNAQGVPVAYWPIPPHWIMATPTPNFRFFRVSFKAWRGNIPDTEFVWFSDPDPLNPYGRGSGSAMALGDELDTDEYAARHTKQFFYNQARPDLIIYPKGQTGIRPENLKRVEEDWMSQAQGFFRSFKPYFLSREVEVKELEHNFRSMQMVQLREFERDAILQHYGVPPEILGVLSNSNRATIDAADYFMSRYVVEPRLEFQRTVLQERVIPEYDDRIIIDYVSPVAEDWERHLKAAKTAPGALTVDEWRALSGHAPHEDEEAGKLHFVPNTVKLQSLKEYEPPPPAPGMPGGPPLPGQPPQPGDARPPKPADDEEEEEGEEPPRRGIDLPGMQGVKAQIGADLAVASEAGDTELAGVLGTLLKAEPDEMPVPSQLAARFEPRIMRALLQSWKQHMARVDVARLEAALQAGVEGDVVALLDPDGLSTAQTAAVSPLLVATALRGVELGASDLRHEGVMVRTAAEPVEKLDEVRGIALDGVPKQSPMVIDLGFINPQVAAWARLHAAELVFASQEVRERVRALVVRAAKEGIAPPELARLLRSVVGLNKQQQAAVENFRAKLLDMDIAASVREARVARYADAQRRARALTIARTESIAALTHGQQATWTQAVRQGIIAAAQFVQVWLVTQDDLLDEHICEPLADTTAPLGGTFSGGYSGPPAHPRCRCAVGLQPASAPRRR